MLGRNGTHMLVYSTEEGGIFRCIARSSPEQFDDVRNSRRLAIKGADREGGPLYPDDYVEPFFIALVRIEDNFDFGFGKSRDEVERARNELRWIEPSTSHAA